MPDADRSTVAQRLAEVRQQIRDAADKHHRNPEDIHLVAVSKTKPASMVVDALAADQLDFGENYLQDALDKIQAFNAGNVAADNGNTPVWHFIGDIQSNKTRDIASNFAWVHAIDRFKIARRLSDQRADDMPPLNLCIQVNIDDQDSKSGVAADDAHALAAEIVQLPNIRLRGLMTIPAWTEDLESQRKPFRAMRELMTRLNEAGYELDTLSMGMTADIEAAIAEGATHLRVGRAIFGERDG